MKDYPVLGEVKTTESITTLVAKSVDGVRTVLLVADYHGLPGDIVIGTKGLPFGVPNVCVLDHTRNLETVDLRLDGSRLILPKRDRESASYVIRWR